MVSVRNRIVLVASLLLAGSCDSVERIAGPATLVGTVRSIATGQPLAGATLSADGVETTTGDQGKFILEGLPIGPIVVLVTRDGYDDLLQPVTLVAGMDTTQIQMVPKSSGQYLDSLSFTYPGGSVRMTGPGSVRIGVKASYSSYHPGPGQVDTTSIAVTTTGPLTAEWELGYVGFRAVKVTATAPGTGTVTISYDGKVASIPVSAEELELKSFSVSSGYGCGIALDDTA